MNLRIAAQQALEALENHTHEAQRIGRIAVAINALRAALAEDRPAYAGKTSDHIADADKMVEPVAWMVYTLDGQSAFITDNPSDFTPEHRALPLYTAPPKREPLTGTEKTVEPVAFFYKNFTRRIRGILTQEDFVGDKSAFLEYCMSDENLLPLYTAPPKRKPLTDEEIRKVVDMTIDGVTVSESVTFRAFARAIERAHGIGGEE